MLFHIMLKLKIIVKPIEGQVDDLIERIRKVVENNGKILVSTLTKKLAQEITDYFISIPWVVENRIEVKAVPETSGSVGRK